MIYEIILILLSTSFDLCRSINYCLVYNKFAFITPRSSSYFINCIPKQSNLIKGDRNSFVVNSTIDTAGHSLVGLSRSEFPIYEYNPDLIYFDNASTTHKPRIVLKTIEDFYSKDCSNVNRSLYRLSSIATEEYHRARHKVADFINASHVNEIVFTSGATESLNLIANTWGYEYINQGDVILLPISEHNSNIVPWQLLSQRRGCTIEYINLNDDGSIDLNHLEELLKSYRVKLVSVAHASNVLGIIQDLKKIIELVHLYNAVVIVDACQTLGHIPIDVVELDCDFLVGSGHKMYGPTGVGFLYSKLNILNSIKPYKGGGGMVDTISPILFQPLDLPYKFEPGTPPIAQAIGLAAAIDFINNVSFDNIQVHELKLLSYLYDHLKGVRTLGFDITKPRLPIFSFLLDGINPYDLSLLLSSKDVSVRCGKHCAHLLHDYLKVDNTIRVSFGLYNNIREIDRFIENLELKDEINSDIKV